jgi:hypothetical protein
MKYVKLENNNNYPLDYTIEQLFIDYPDAVIYKDSEMPSKQLLENYNVYPLITTTPPLPDDGYKAVEGIPELIEGEWHQTWRSVQLSEEEIKDIISNYNGIPTEIVANVDSWVFVNEETKNARQAICNSCPSLNRLQMCRECGCIIPLKIKLKSSTCPIGNW